MSSFSYKGILSILVSVFLVSGILYASSTIISVQTQSIAQGDVIANGWFQEVNDKLVNIFSSGGNVGIGTNNPTYKFQTTWNIAAKISTNDSNSITIGNSTRNWNLYNLGWVDGSSPNAFLIENCPLPWGCTRALTITKDNNVWIGVTNPSVKFQVSWGISKLEQEWWQVPALLPWYRQCLSACWGGTTYRVGFIKDSLGFVRLKWLVESPSSLYTWANPIFRLPAWYWPLDHAEFIVAINWWWAHIIVTNLWYVYIENYSWNIASWVSLDWVSFPTF